MEEKDYNVAPGLIHVIAVAHCSLSHKPAQYTVATVFVGISPMKIIDPLASLATKLDYLRKNANINEIILSGGDPLAVSNKQLQWLTQQLAAIPHIKTLRIHSRLPIVLPKRIDSDFIAWLKAWPGHKVLVIHSNHANEIDSHVKQAINNIASTALLF